MSKITMNPLNFNYHIERTGESYPIVYLDYAFVRYLMSVSMKTRNPMDKAWNFEITLVVKKDDKAISMKCGLKNIFYGSTLRLTLHSILMDDFCLNGIDKIVPVGKSTEAVEYENEALGLTKKIVPINIDSPVQPENKKRELVRVDVRIYNS